MNEPLTLAGFTTTPLELFSMLLSLAMVLLDIRRNHWAWLLAIVSSGAYAVVFFDAKLYGDAGLQAVFIGAAAWGWYKWLHGAGGKPLVVTRLDGTGWTWSLIGWLAGYVLLRFFLATYTNSDVPDMDAFLTAGSLVATAQAAYKKVENWITWIVVDVLYVGLYVFKNLHVTAALYAGFVVMAAFGLAAWRRAARVGTP
jgi:nicotinamide mononucleotide transporter